MVSTVSYTYDARGRLIDEQRTGRDFYHLSYEYDQGGNRIKKVDHDVSNPSQTCYHYDLEDPARYGTKANRLMYSETFDSVCGDCSTCANPVVTTWYYYTMAGNVRRVVTREEPAAASLSGTVGAGLDGDGSWSGGAKRLGGACGAGEAEYFATRFEYACNGETVTYAVGERWCADANNLDAPPTETETRWAREFRYDGARQRYLNRPLDPTLFGLVQDLPGGEYVETVYDGDEAVRDKRNGGGLPGRLFSAGIARVEPFDSWNPPNGGDLTEYYHTDHLGTTRLMSDPSGNPIDFNGPADSGVDTVYTAFGEPIVNTFADGGSNRYGYVGAHGYQAHDEMPFLHVGHRYYDPSTGRFLQRDPIGIDGGINLYIYVRDVPTVSSDPSGLFTPLPGLINPVVLPRGDDIARGMERVYDPLGRAADWLNRLFDGLINGTPSGVAGAGLGAGVAVNYKWKLGIGKFLNRATVALAGTYIGWNAGKWIDSNIVGPAQDAWFRFLQRVLQNNPPGYPLPGSWGRSRNRGNSGRSGSNLMCI